MNFSLDYTMKFEFLLNESIFPFWHIQLVWIAIIIWPLTKTTKLTTKSLPWKSDSLLPGLIASAR